MKRYFCTYFDHNYMMYGLTMFRSLVETGIDFQIFVLCLSDETFEKLSGFDDRLLPIRLQDLEEYDPELKACKQNRSKVEYIFTISPCLPLFLFNRFPHIDLLTYLDADLYFVSSPECLYEELGNKSLYIIEHRFPANRQFQIDLYGRFNVAFQIYRNNRTGIDCLSIWRKECLAWCKDKAEDGKFADQKYLDSWPDRYGDEVVVSQNKGANLAPWNIDNYSCRFSRDMMKIDGEKVIFIHYQGFRVLTRYFFKWSSHHQKKENDFNFRFLAKFYHRCLNKTVVTYPELFNNKPLCSFSRENYIILFKCSRLAESFSFFRLLQNLYLLLKMLYFNLRHHEELYFGVFSNKPKVKSK